MIGLWTLGILAAVGAESTSLEQVRARAVQEALGVLAAEASRDQAVGQATSAIEGALPAVEGFAQVTTGQGLTGFGFVRPVSTQIGIGGSLSWRVIDVASWLRASSARTDVRRSEAAADWARVDARREATARYAVALGVQEETEALRRVAARSQAVADAVGERVQAGLVPDIDGLRARSDAAVAQAAVAQAEGRLAAACAELQSLLDEAITGACRLEPVSWGTPAEGPAQHPSLRAFALALDASRASSQASGAALGPVLSASGTAAHYIVPASDTQGFGWNVGATLSVPLPGASSVGARQVAVAQQTAAEVALEAQRRALEVQRVTSERQLRAAQEALAAQETSLEASREARDRAEVLYRAGEISLTDLLDAERAWAASLRAVATAKAAVGAALADTEAARGVF